MGAAKSCGRLNRLGQARGTSSSRSGIPTVKVFYAARRRVAVVKPAQARQRNQAGVGGWFWLEGPPIRGPENCESCPRRSQIKSRIRRRRCSFHTNGAFESSLVNRAWTRFLSEVRLCIHSTGRRSERPTLAARGVSQFLAKPLRRFNELQTTFRNFWTSATGC